MAIVHQRGFRPRIYEESPWYAPIRTLLARFDVLGRFPTAEELSALYEERTRGLDLPPLCFVAAKKSKKRRARGEPVDLGATYEGRILERGEVPTRPDDWHDLFNALAFVTFPRAKRALHARQYGIMRSRLAPAATRLPNARTREQDALSLFDEGGLCVAAPPEALGALCEADDATLAQALSTRRAVIVPFGHALYEHLVAGLPCPLATVQLVPLAPEVLDGRSTLAALDEALAGVLADPRAFREPSRARGSSLSGLLATAP